MAIEKVRMTKTKQRRILRNIMVAIFKPVLEEEKRQRKEWAAGLARRSDPKFFELYADEKVRPYLEYSTSREICIRPILNRRGRGLALEQGRDKFPSYDLRTPSLYNDPVGCINDIGIRAFYDDSVYSNNRPDYVYVMKHSKATINLMDSESLQYWAFRERDNVIQKDFDSLKGMLKTALAASRYVGDFHTEYPQFSHITGEAAEVASQAPLPVPTAGTLIDAINNMGLHVPSPLETEKAKDGSDMSA